MPTLAEVFALADSHRASQVKFNIETKVEAGAPQETAPREQFVDVALREIRTAHMQSRVSIESFDWGSLRLVQQRDPADPHRGADQQGLPPGRPARQVAVAGRHRRR